MADIMKVRLSISEVGIEYVSKIFLYWILWEIIWSVDHPTNILDLQGMESLYVIVIPWA